MSTTETLDTIYMELLGVHAELRELKKQKTSLGLMTFADIQEEVGLGKSATYKLLARPDAPKKIRLSGTCVRYRRSDVENFFNSLQEK